MKASLEEAWQNFRADVMTDPQYRYTHDHKEIFRAGWRAGQTNHPAGTRSVWITAPDAIDDDPE
jgi:hypothetical protein